MQLKVVKTLWGCIERPYPEKWDELFARIKSQGFDGIEIPVSVLAMPAEEFKELVGKHGLFLIAQIHTATYTPGNKGVVGSSKVDVHLKSFREQLTTAKEFGAIFANSHSGHDSWDIETAVSFCNELVAIEKEVGLSCCHETHRRRLLWNPWQARDIMKRVPELKINADLSHWVCAGERIFDETISDEWWPEVLDLLSQRCAFIHARVGYAQGPQVPHPAAPEYEPELLAHERWWAAILKGMHARGLETVCMEPEFGPDPYQQALPFTKAPTADIWEINNWVKDRIRASFATMFPQ